MLSVGKTSLMTRYVDNRYTQEYRATVGADFMAKEVMIDDKVVSL
jgi:Ras-related protein Rab-7A